MNRLTVEIIERCLELESVEILGQSGSETFNGDAWSEIQAFREHVVSSQKLRDGFLRAISAVCDDGSTGIEHITTLLGAGKLNFRRIQILEDVFRQFFFLGWHARGAVEQGKAEN